jgi:hypothetical protein
MDLQASTNLVKPNDVQFGISASWSAVVWAFSELPFIGGWLYVLWLLKWLCCRYDGTV